MTFIFNEGGQVCVNCIEGRGHLIVTGIASHFKTIRKACHIRPDNLRNFPDCFEMAGYSCHDEMSSTLDTIVHRSEERRVGKEC